MMTVNSPSSSSSCRAGFFLLCHIAKDALRLWTILCTSWGLLGLCVPLPKWEGWSSSAPLTVIYDCAHSHFPLLQGENSDFPPVEFTWGSLYPVGDSSLLPLNWLFPQGLWGSQSLNPSAKATAEQSLSLQEGAALGSLVTAQQSVPSDCPLREVRAELALWFQMPHQPGTPSSSLASNSKAPLFLTSWTPNASCPLLPRLRCLPLSHHVPVYCSANVTTTFNTAYVG